jgi:hypothetical protein
MESRLLEVESGTLTVSIAADSAGPAMLLKEGSTASDVSQEVGRGTSARLASGDLIALPSTTSYLIGNDGTGPATALVAAFFAPDDPMRAVARADPSLPPSAGPWPPVLAVETLIGGSADDLPGGEATVGFGRAVLEPGGSIQALTPRAPLMVSMVTGTVVLTASNGTAWVRSGVSGASQDMADGLLAAGDGALLTTGATVSLLNAGAAPAVVQIAAVSPGE